MRKINAIAMAAVFGAAGLYVAGALVVSLLPGG